MTESGTVSHVKSAEHILLVTETSGNPKKINDSNKILITDDSSNNNKQSNKNKSAHSGRVVTSLIAGAIAGAMAKTAIAPLDRTKIYFQTNNKTFSFPGVMNFLVKSYKENGLSSLWQGNSATMIRVVPYAAIQYSSHEHFKHLLNVETNSQKREHPLRSFIAGSLAGLTSTAATYPLDVARARMAVRNYHGLTEVFIDSIKSEGILSLYRGFVPTVLGVVPYAGCSFFTYETLKRLHYDFYDETEPNPFFRLLFGATAGLVGQSASYPLDIVRRRMQTQNGYSEMGIIGTMRKVVLEEGLIYGLYKGLSLNWIKGPISVGISFTSFDMIYKRLMILWESDSFLTMIGCWSR